MGRDVTEHEKQPKDTLDRPLRSLRVSVTDRCNIRCQYCMPEDRYVWLPRRDLLTFEETAQLVDIFTEIGVTKIRLTGGEPLLRKDVATLVRMLAENPRVEDLALTTNGLVLAEHAQSLFDAGLHRVTVSLDTLRPERFEALTRNKNLEKVIHGMESAREVGFRELKIDSVILRGTNEDELIDLIELGKRIGAEIRFIEYMDVGGATQWSMDRVYTKAEMLESLEKHYGIISPVVERRWAPADRYRLSDGTRLGIISSITDPFCRTCDRSRLTADGRWYLCLYAEKGIDLRKPLRDRTSREELKSLIRSEWTAREERGAELRNELPDRSVLIEADELRRNPHREMHTRGG
jgi:cyclic pyranopterin phosphate synthase